MATKIDMKYRIIMEAPLFIILSFFLSAAISFLCRADWLGVSFLAVAIILILVCLRKVEATPPHVGLAIIWGIRIPSVLKEGYHLVWSFFPFLYNFIPINVEKRNMDLAPQGVRTKEGAGLNVKIPLTWGPNKDDGNDLISYINAGGEEGVKKILPDIVAEATRISAAEKASWENLIAAKIEVSEKLIEEISGCRPISMADMRMGNGLARIPMLGIVLNKLNIGEMELTGNLAKIADQVAIEKKQREADKVEIRNVRDRAKELVSTLKISGKEALNAVQVERGKSTKAIHEYIGFEGLRLEGLGEGLAKAVEAFFARRGS